MGRSEARDHIGYGNAGGSGAARGQAARARRACRLSTGNARAVLWREKFFLNANCTR